MKSIQNTLQWLYDNWSAIIICIGLILGLYEKIKAYMNLSQEEKVKAAKAQIRETILDYVSKAELDRDYLVKAGELKRAEVLKKVYTDYPVLQKVVDQDELIRWMDELIDDALPTVRDIIENTLGDSSVVDDSDDMNFIL